MAERLRRRQDDDCARSADPSLRNHRDRKRELALQAPRLSRCTAPACPGGQTGTSRAALRRTRGGHSAPRGSLLFATGTSLNLRPRGVTIGRRSGVKLQRRLTLRCIDGGFVGRALTAKGGPPGAAVQGLNLSTLRSAVRVTSPRPLISLILQCYNQRRDEWNRRWMLCR